MIQRLIQEIKAALTGSSACIAGGGFIGARGRNWPR
jgi:hypothetical protein